jgi:hypothetical protein
MVEAAEHYHDGRRVADLCVEGAGHYDEETRLRGTEWTSLPVFSKSLAL